MRKLEIEVELAWIKIAFGDSVSLIDHTVTFPHPNTLERTSISKQQQKLQYHLLRVKSKTTNFPSIYW